MKDLKMEVNVKKSFGEKIGWWIILISIIIPGMIVTGFMPDMNILPSYGWTAVGMAGAALGCVISTKKILLGSVCGGLVGAGAILGLTTYVDIRVYLTGTSTFYSLELLIGGLIGAVPGILLYLFFVRNK